jgi:hypothetical protein
LHAISVLGSVRIFTSSVKAEGAPKDSSHKSNESLLPKSVWWSKGSDPETPIWGGSVKRGTMDYWVTTLGLKDAVLQATFHTRCWDKLRPSLKGRPQPGQGMIRCLDMVVKKSIGIIMCVWTG